MRKLAAAALAACLALPASAQDQQSFRAIYKEMVETNTTFSSGDCTLLAQKMASRLKAVGYPDSDLHIFTVPDHLKEGSLVAVLPGSDAKAKAILLLAHLDVVEAKREDWTRDPFTLVEEDGYFYGRGTADDKSVAAIWVDIMVHFKQDKIAHRRPLKLALTCGEETNGAFNGAKWLAASQRALIDAEFGLTEGGWGTMGENGGKPIALGINAGEKLSQNYTLEVTNPGGHSMRPVKDNAIYHLSAGLLKIGAYDFPTQSTDASREYFARMAPLTGGEMGGAMTAFYKNDKDAKVASVLAADPRFNAAMRTTCVATLINGGHATNALPQRVTANVNCRIFPGTTPQDVRDKLQELVADSQIKIVAQAAHNDPSPAPPLTPALMKPLVSEAAKRWPGVPVIPQLEIGATDASFMTPAGIPTYGFTGMFFEPDGSRLHGLNERIRAKVLYDARDYLTDLIRIYAK
ncbi:MAG: M20/M25/M40 family metallo-hydrolase [Alphaproteobacteria bacterium]|nr:M20/M25/M40 family metallo-hydrolase [Alphaproteobacteria bacterium]